MFVDTLNEFYGELYEDMRPDYESWRKFNRTERTAMRQVKREAAAQMFAGILLVAAGAALEVSGAEDVGSVTSALALAGGQVIVNGVNVSKGASIHADAIQELSNTLAEDMRPLVMEMEGQVYELSGTAEEQYQQVRQLLREIYLEETGLQPRLEDEPRSVADHASAP